MTEKDKKIIQPPPSPFSESERNSGKYVTYVYFALDKGGDIFFIVKDGQSLQ